MTVISTDPLIVLFRGSLNTQYIFKSIKLNSILKRAENNQASVHDRKTKDEIRNK